MIHFQTLTVRNFLSYGNNTTVFQLDRPGTTLIVGEDLDNTSEGQGSNGVGKAQPLHSKIKTPTGWTTMGEIAVGDLVSTPTGVPAAVVGTFPQGMRQTYKITFSDGRSAEADEDHLWTVFSHRWPTKNDKRGTRNITTKQLALFVAEANEKQAAWHNIFVPLVNHPLTDDVDLPIHPYLLGALLGDGGMTSRSITFANEDSDCVQRVNQLLNDECNQELVSYDDSINYQVRTRGSRTNNIANALSLVGLIGCNSLSKFIPNVYREASAAQKLQLLRGLLDTDGTVGSTANVSFSSSSEQLALDVQYVVRSLGGKATISVRRPTYTYQGEQGWGQLSYNVSIAYPTPQDLFTTNRKRDRLLITPTQYANSGLRVVSVEMIGMQECKCIVVDHPDHLYVTDDFIVTHNTTLLQALVYSLYDRVIGDDVTKDGLINDINKKEMEVTLDFIAENGKSYRVVRQRKMKAGAEGNRTHLYENGVDISVSVDGTNAKLVEILGMQYELFVRIIVFSASNDSFLKLPTTSTTTVNQRDFIEDLFGLSVITEKADKLKQIIKDTKSDMSFKQSQLEAQQAERDRHLSLVDSTQKRLAAWETQRASNVKSLEAKLLQIDGVDVTGQKAIHTQVRKVAHTIDQIAADKVSAMRECKQHSLTFAKIDKDIEVLRDNKCPHCKQAYSGAADEIRIKERELITLDSTIEDLTKQVHEHDQMLSELNELHEQLSQQITVDNVEELVRIQSDVGNIRDRVEELKIERNPHTDALNELNAVTFEELKYDHINALQVEIDHLNFLHKLLTKSDSFVRKSLLNKYLPFLNGRLQHYLQMLGLPHTVEFQEDLVAKISHMGVDTKFGNLSTGQKARVNFAFAVAFKDVRERLHGRANICMFDEVLDFGLDAVGVMACAKVIKYLARTEGVSMYVISHRSEIDSVFDRKMTIQRIKRFSYVKEE